MFYGPYNFIESLNWIRKYVAGPPASVPDFFAQNSTDKKYHFCDIQNEISIVFLGDLMSLGDRALHFSDHFKTWSQDATHHIINLEAIVTNKKNRFHLKQFNNESILKDLIKLNRPENIILSVANNHALDFGPEELEKSISRISNCGFNIIGTQSRPSFCIDNRVNIVAVTEWSNQRGVVLSDLNTAFEPKNILPQCDLNFLFAHWGHEFEMYPRANELLRGQELLNHWDAVIGHHSHCPQPVKILSDNHGKIKPLAFSLGNMAIAYRKEILNSGLALKVKIGPSVEDVHDNTLNSNLAKNKSNQWKIGSIEWEKIKINISKNDVEIFLMNSGRGD